MAIDLDELMPKKPKAETVLGEDLSAKSAHELEARIASARSGDRAHERCAARAGRDQRTRQMHSSSAEIHLFLLTILTW